nr:alcohol dehydrogenase [Candidatus Pantoea persica]
MPLLIMAIGCGALLVGMMQGMPINKVILAIKHGVGGTLGSLALIMGFGAMLGKLLADCGGAQRIATTLIEKFGKQHIQWALLLTSFTVGFALFYKVGFVLMLPLVFSISRVGACAAALRWGADGGRVVGNARFSAAASRPNRHRHAVQRRHE